MKILIAEDDPGSQLVLQRMLSPFGEVQVTKNGREALEAFITGMNQRKPFQLICLDIMMPGLDGLSVLRRIRGIEKGEDVSPDKRVRIIMTTALRDKENVMAAIQGQCDGYIVKPLDQQQVLGRMRELGFKTKNDGQIGSPP